MREACGIVGVYMPKERAVSNTVLHALFALQHRGQESAGITTSDGAQMKFRGNMGLINQAFDDEDMRYLAGHIGVGHTRYSTAGSTRTCNIQPFVVPNASGGKLAFAHNGNLINAIELKELLESTLDTNTSRNSSTDSELIAHLYASAPGADWGARSDHCMSILKGAYSLVMMTENELIGVRDPHGIRPLCLGKFPNGGWVLASETVALDHVGATLEHELENGETVVINADGVKSYKYRHIALKKEAMCIFEYIYFARPDSILNNRLTYETRLKMGANLAKEHPVDADIVIGVPDSATAASIGYAREANIPYGEGLIRNRYSGRTFITPDKHLRELGVYNKFNPLVSMIENKRVVVVDDSVVRGNTTSKIVSMLRNANAREVHMRISSPPVVSTCHFGVDMATRAELIAANFDVEEIREKMNLDSLGYLSFDGLLESVGRNLDNRTCSGCFTKNYPIPVQLDMDKMELERLSPNLNGNGNE